MYAYGEGVPKDEMEAAKWYRKAAERGSALGQSNLGHAYFTGQGVAKDEIEAYKWWLLAKAQGNENAKNHCGILEPKLSALDREEGQRRAREFKPAKS